MDRFIEQLSNQDQYYNTDLKSNMDRFIAEGSCVVHGTRKFKIQYG